MAERIIGGKAVPFGVRLLFRCETLPKLTVGVEICEDVWNLEPPSLALCRNGAMLIVNLSASPGVGWQNGLPPFISHIHVRADNLRVCLFQHRKRRIKRRHGLCRAQHDRGKQRHAGRSHAVFRHAALCAEIDVTRLAFERRRMTTYPQQETGYTVTPFTLPYADTALTRRIDPHPFVPSEEADRTTRCDLVLSIQAEGLKKRLEHIGCGAAILGRLRRFWIPRSHCL